MQASYPSPLKRLFAESSSVNLSSGILVAVLSAPIVFALWLIAKPGGDSALIWFDDLMLFGMSAAASAAAIAAAVRYRGTRTGVAWSLIGLGMAFMAFGEGAWGFEELVLGRDVNSPAIADIGYLGFYIPVFLGLLAMPHVPVSGLRRIRFVVETTIATGAVALISWYFLIADLIGQSGGFSLDSAITIAYPALDLAIIFAAFSIVMRGGRNLTNASIALLTLGFVCIALSDSVYTYLSEVDEYNSGNYFDIGWMLGYSIITVAGMLAAGRRLNLDRFKDDEHRRAPLWQTAALSVSLVAPVAVLFLNLSGGEFRVDVVVMSAFIALVVLSLIRECLLHAENARRHRQLEELTVVLSEQVTAQRMQNLSR